VALAGHAAAVAAGGVVAAYASVGDEPPTRALLEALRRRGVSVLLPVLDGRDLSWGHFDAWSTLVRRAHGLLEPAVADATVRPAVALVPALAVDRTGRRLGRGGGFYDRWLSRARPPAVVAVLYEDELVDEVPAEDHDVPVDAVLTPTGLVVLRQRVDVLDGVGEEDARGLLDGDAAGVDGAALGVDAGAEPTPGSPGS
jgi:5-formyltetrahydrofolate cyclo-ligase